MKADIIWYSFLSDIGSAQTLTDLFLLLIFLDTYTLEVYSNAVCWLVCFFPIKVRDPGGPNSGRVSFPKGPLQLASRLPHHRYVVFRHLGNKHTVYCMWIPPHSTLVYQLASLSGRSSFLSTDEAPSDGAENVTGGARDSRLTLQSRLSSLCCSVKRVHPGSLVRGEASGRGECCWSWLHLPAQGDRVTKEHRSVARNPLPADMTHTSPRCGLDRVHMGTTVSVSAHLDCNKIPFALLSAARGPSLKPLGWFCTSSTWRACWSSLQLPCSACPRWPQVTFSLFLKKKINYSLKNKLLKHWPLTSTSCSALSRRRHLPGSLHGAASQAVLLPGHQQVVPANQTGESQETEALVLV